MTGFLNPLRNIHDGDWLKITRPDYSVIYVKIEDTNVGSTSVNHSDTFTIDTINPHKASHKLDWSNCYSFGNGVESNRISDNFNTPHITPGVKVSTVFEDYKEEYRKYGLIYSGIYNSISNTNRLNQFIQAEKITKDINPIYGSIQKLHTRDTDLITLCEDKVLRILANKDAVYNADGKPQLTANENVLGQAVPFVGEFGISKNPESFASESYRTYFTDKQRGAVMRLSKDGLTPISMHGMKDWFRDNLSTTRVNLLGEDNFSSNDNWNHNSTTDNIYVKDGVATFGYYNSYIHSNQAFRIAGLRKDNVLEIGKKYRLQFDVTSHSGYNEESGGFGAIRINNTPPGEAWQSVGTTGSEVAGNHVIYEWIANREILQMYQSQLNDTAGIYDGVTIEEFVGGIRGEDGSSVPYTWWGGSHFYGGTVTIENMVLEEVKVEPKIIGSYDSRQNEYNVTVHSENPTTVSFREDVKGWVSFKSFVPENAISCANDYYTMKDGKLWQHHVAGINNNTFYNTYTNSSINVILNDQPGSVKSFHTLDYEGSDSRVEGIRTAEVTGIEHAGGASHDGRYFFFEKEDMSKVIGNHDLGSWHGTLVNMKQYRNNILIHSGSMKIFNDPTLNSGTVSPSGGPTKGHGRYEPYSSSNPGNWQVGDVITTEQQEKTVNHFNSMPKDGWYVSNIETDKQKGNLPEFIEKEGKWFNYIKGVHSDVDSTTNFGSFDIQGIGLVDSINLGESGITPEITFANNINSSLQIGDTLYFERPSEMLGENLVTDGAFDAGAVDSSWTIDPELAWAIDSGVAVGGIESGSLRQFIGDSDTLIEGEIYEITYDIVTESTAGGELVLFNHGAGTNIDLLESNTVATHKVRWVQGPNNTNRVKLYSNAIFDGSIDNISVRKVSIADVFGFTRLESNNIQKCGIVTNIVNNVVTIDNSGTAPNPKDYIMFVKNQAVNTSSLLGYYADVKFENNAMEKVEMFSVGSEIAESSK